MPAGVGYNEDGTPKASVPSLKKSNQGGLIKDMSKRVKKGGSKSLGRSIVDDVWNLGSAAAGIVGEGLKSGNRAGSSLPQFPRLGTPAAYNRAVDEEMGGLRRQLSGEGSGFDLPNNANRAARGATGSPSSLLGRGSSNPSDPRQGFPYQNPSSGALSGSPAYRQGAVGLPPTQPYEAPLTSNPSYNPSLGSALPLSFDASSGLSPVDDTFYDPSQGDQLQQKSNPRARILNPMKSAATKREADLKANYATSDLTVDSKRASRAEATSQRRAETQERQLSRDTNMAYREAIRRGDRAGALRVRQGAIRDNVQFGGIRQHGDIGRNVAGARQNAFDDERGRLDAMAAARKGVPQFQGVAPAQAPTARYDGQASGVTPSTFNSNAGAVTPAQAGFASSDHDVTKSNKTLPKALRMITRKLP